MCVCLFYSEKKKIDLLKWIENVKENWLNYLG